MPLRQTLRQALLALALLTTVCLPGSAGAQAIDFKQLPGPWENHLAPLPDRVDGEPLNMHYLAAGEVGKPTVVLLHGFPDFSYGWRSIMPLLARDYRVIAPDLRGYAGTDKPRRGYDLDTLADDIIALLNTTAEAEGREPGTPVHLITHDWGTSIGWHVATFHPEALLSFTAMDVPHPSTLAAFSEISAAQRDYYKFVGQMVFPLTPRLMAGMSLKARRGLYDDLTSRTDIDDETLAIYHQTYSDVHNTRPPLRYYKQLRRNKDAITSTYATAAKVSIPTLVLWGADDTYMISDQAALCCEQVSARCEAQVWENANHQLPWDVPELIVERWVAFVESQPAPQAVSPTLDEATASP